MSASLQRSTSNVQRSTSKDTHASEEAIVVGMEMVARRNAVRDEFRAFIRESDKRARCCFGLGGRGPRCGNRIVVVLTFRGQRCRGVQGPLGWCADHEPSKPISEYPHGRESV